MAVGGCYEGRIPRETPRKIGRPVCLRNMYASEDTTSILPQPKTRRKVTSRFFPFTFLPPTRNNKKVYAEGFSFEALRVARTTQCVCERVTRKYLFYAYNGCIKHV